MRATSALRNAHVRTPLLAVGGGCLAMLTYESGLWEIGVVAFLVVFALSSAHRNRVQLLGFTSIGLASALAWVALVPSLGAPCGSSSAQPLVCSAVAGPSIARYAVAAVVLALAGALLVALQRRDAGGRVR
jgi:uncharacterized membrane protein